MIVVVAAAGEDALDDLAGRALLGRGRGLAGSLRLNLALVIAGLVVQRRLRDVQQVVDAVALALTGAGGGGGGGSGVDKLAGLLKLRLGLSLLLQ